ncbi:MAG: DUF6502 family protein [Gammaproteobacteria bacterium]|nr:DUF6502 family protein [Gammaproteobacteria bacterium]
MECIEKLLPDTGLRRAVYRFIIKILYRLAGIVLWHRISIHEFNELARYAFVKAAMHSPGLGIVGKPQSKSRVSILTGLSRKEVQRILEMPSPVERNDELITYDLAARVLSGWLKDPLFQDDAGRPRILPYKSPANLSFVDLVNRYCTDIPPRAMYDELLRCRAIEHVGDNKLKFVNYAYIAENGSEELIELTGTCSEDLLSTIGHNLQPDQSDPRLQKFIWSPKIPSKHKHKVKKAIEQKTSRYIDEINRLILSYEDPNQAEQDYTHLGLGLYYFERPIAKDI